MKIKIDYRYDLTYEICEIITYLCINFFIIVMFLIMIVVTLFNDFWRFLVFYSSFIVLAYLHYELRQDYLQAKILCACNKYNKLYKTENNAQ